MGHRLSKRRFRGDKNILLPTEARSKTLGPSRRSGVVKARYRNRPRRANTVSSDLGRYENKDKCLWHCLSC